MKYALSYNKIHLYIMFSFATIISVLYKNSGKI